MRSANQGITLICITVPLGVKCTGPRDLQNLFAITRFHCIEVLFHMFYNSVKKLFVICRFVISWFHCSSDLFYGFRWFSCVLQAQTEEF